MGGNWNESSNAGLWYVNCNNAASNTNSNIGARLANDITGQKVDAHGYPSSAYPSGWLSRRIGNGATKINRCRRLVPAIGQKRGRQHSFHQQKKEAKWQKP